MIGNLAPNVFHICFHGLYFFHRKVGGNMQVFGIVPVGRAADMWIVWIGLSMSFGIDARGR